MNRTLAAVAVATLGLGLLSACGNDDASGSTGARGDYCADLKAAKADVDALQDGDFGSLEKTTEAMHRLADEAPEEISEDWQTLVDGVDALVALLREAGLTDDDIKALQDGQVPAGVDMAALQELMGELQQLDDRAFQAATDAVGAHAEDECGVDLDA